jgi:streptogramin lyase
MRLAPVVPLLVLALSTTALAGGGSTPVQTHVVPTGKAPCGVVAARDGGLWIGVYGAGTVLRVDPRRGKVTTRVRVGPWACRVVVGPAAVWVTRDRAGEIVRIARGSGRLRRMKVGAGAFDVVLARGSIWATSFDVGTVAEIDAATTKLVRVYRDGANPAGITSCRGRIWVGHGREATWLTSIDPETRRMRRVDVAVKNPGWPRCIGGELWVTTSDTVLRVDARTGDVLGRIRVGGTPAEATAGPDGLVWVTDKERSLVHRVDPARVALVDSFPAGPGAYSLARTGPAVWVTSFAGSDARRYEP